MKSIPFRNNTCTTTATTNVNFHFTALVTAASSRNYLQIFAHTQCLCANNPIKCYYGVNSMQEKEEAEEEKKDLQALHAAVTVLLFYRCALVRITSSSMRTNTMSSQ